MQGTFNLWKNNSVAGEKSGQPEPMFPSPNVANRNVGFDPEFAFAGVKAPGGLSAAVQRHPGRGKTWAHPASSAAFDAREDKSTYVLTGADAPLHVRLSDTPSPTTPEA